MLTKEVAQPPPFKNGKPLFFGNHHFRQKHRFDHATGQDVWCQFLVHELDADAFVAHVAAVNDDRIAIVVNDVVATLYPSAAPLKGGDGYDLHGTFPKQRAAI